MGRLPGEVVDMAVALAEAQANLPELQIRQHAGHRAFPESVPPSV